MGLGARRAHGHRDPPDQQFRSVHREYLGSANTGAVVSGKPEPMTHAEAFSEMETPMYQLAAMVQIIVTIWQEPPGRPSEGIKRDDMIDVALTHLDGMVSDLLVNYRTNPEQGNGLTR